MAEKNTATSKKAGRLSAVSSSFIEHSSFLRRFLTKFLCNRQDIEDVMQEAYLRAYQAEKGKDIERPKAFLFEVAKNVALTELSRKSRQITDYIEEIDSAIQNENTASLEEEQEARQHLDLFCAAVAALPERRRKIYLLRKVHGLSHREIARREGISVSAVEKHLLKGVLFCQTYVDQHEQSNELKEQPKVIPLSGRG
ncbi:RNA polymerase sigma factor [Porticoccus sp. GXU_MW_L64]